MPIYFRSTPVTVPFMFETVGNDWLQAAVRRPAGHPHYHYLQTEKGSGIIDVRGISYTLKEYEGILIAPDVPHSYRSSGGEWITAFATFTGTIQSGISSMVHANPVTFIPAEQGILAGPLISRAAELHREQLPDLKAISACCYELLLCLTDCADRQTFAEDPLYQRYVLPVIKEIETRYAEDLTTVELSALVYITPQYLSRLFRRFLGRSVYEYLTLCRISRARELLFSKPHTRIQDIAREVGFNDPSHFIAMFKKITGSTPLECRRMY